MAKRIYHGEECEKLLASIGAEIKRRRQRLGMSQRGFAHAIGCDHTTISNYERGKNNMSIHGLFNIAEALGCEIKDLVR